MDLSVLILLFVVLINLGLLIFILFYQDRQRSWSFFWILTLLLLWQVIELLNSTYLVNEDKDILLFSVRAGLLPALYIAPAFIRLVFSLFGKWDNMSTWNKLKWWVPAIVMSAFVFTPYNVPEVLVNGDRFFYIAGSLYWFFAVYFVALASYGLYMLMKNRKLASPILRRQITYIFVATALTSLAALVFNILLPILGMMDLYYLGINSTVFFTMILTYALFKYRFFNLRISLNQIFMNLFKICIAGFLYYIFYVLFNDLIKIDLNSVKNIVFIFFILALSAPFIVNIINKALLVFFISPENDIKLASNNIVKILRSSRDLDVLLSRLSKEINKVIDYKETFIYLSKKKNLNVFYQVFPVGERLINKSDSDLIKYLTKKKKIANLAEIEYFVVSKVLVSEMKDMNADIVLPIFYNKHLLGILMIDNDSKLLSIQELQFLEDLNKYLDIAVGSLLLYQQDLSNK